MLSADIGGTHARIAIVQPHADGTISILERRRYPCAAFGSLGAIVSGFLDGRSPPPAMAVGVAGTVVDGRVTSRNIPWPIEPAALGALGIREVAAVNDFVATAHAQQCMRDGDTRLLTPAVDRPAIAGPTLVVGPGTGLGAALRVPVGGKTLVLPSEPQQMSLAPGNERELDVVRLWLRGAARPVSNGDAISGPGLLNLYRALCALDGVAPGLQSADEVSGASGNRHAVEAVAMFCGLFGSLVGDLVLASGATRVFIAGGVPLGITPQLLAGEFASRMVAKDIMRTTLERVPVRLIENPDIGVIGAAAWFLQR